MIDREKYEETKKILSQIQHTLEMEPLTAQQREELQILAAQAAGVLSSPWLPMSWS